MLREALSLHHMHPRAASRAVHALVEGTEQHVEHTEVNQTQVGARVERRDKIPLGVRRLLALPVRTGCRTFPAVPWPGPQGGSANIETLC